MNFLPLSIPEHSRGCILYCKQHWLEKDVDYQRRLSLRSKERTQKISDLFGYYLIDDKTALKNVNLSTFIYFFFFLVTRWTAWVGRRFVYFSFYPEAEKKTETGNKTIFRPYIETKNKKKKKNNYPVYHH